MKIFDSHSHIYDKCFTSDFSEILENAYNADVHAIMIVGTDISSSEKAVSIAKSYKNLFASVGFHPHDAKNCSDKNIKILKKLAENSCVKAWGEIGLDFNRMFSSALIQEKWFEKQIQAAKELDLPIIFHERDSNGRFLEILNLYKNEKIKGVIHCFSGSGNELLKYLDMGYFIGITGILTLKQRGQSLRELVKMIPDKQILIETDAPYLAPSPYKNKTRRNEPAFVRSVLIKLSKIKEQEPEKLGKIIWNNTCSLFNI